MGIYRRFGLMILSSTLLMYGLMYSNTSALAHIHFSQTRVWMADKIQSTINQDF